MLWSKLAHEIEKEGNHWCSTPVCICTSKHIHVYVICIHYMYNIYLHYMYNLVYLILIIKGGKNLIFHLLVNKCTVCFSRNEHKPNHSSFLRNDMNMIYKSVFFKLYPLFIYKSSPRVTALQFLFYLSVALPIIKQDCKTIGKMSAQPAGAIEILSIVRIKQKFHSWFMFWKYKYFCGWDYRVKRLKHSTWGRSAAPITLRNISK